MRDLCISSRYQTTKYYSASQEMIGLQKGDVIQNWVVWNMSKDSNQQYSTVKIQTRIEWKKAEICWIYEEIFWLIFLL